MKRHLSEGRPAAFACIAMHSLKIDTVAGEAGDRRTVHRAGQGAPVSVAGKPGVLHEALEFQSVLQPHH